MPSNVPVQRRATAAEAQKHSRRTRCDGRARALYASPTRCNGLLCASCTLRSFFVLVTPRNCFFKIRPNAQVKRDSQERHRSQNCAANLKRLEPTDVLIRRIESENKCSGCDQDEGVSEPAAKYAPASFAN